MRQQHFQFKKGWGSLVKHSKGGLSSIRRAIAGRLTEPVVGVLVRMGLTPNAISWLGFIITLGAAALIITGYPFAAGFVVLLAGFFDILDGALARRSKKVTPFGGILDSTLDRLSEAVLMISIAVYFEKTLPLILLVFLALVGSLLVSYVRARAEGAGLECGVGLFTRAERVIVLALGLLLSHFEAPEKIFDFLGNPPIALVIALAIIAVFSFFTVGQRLVYAWKQAKK